jgi:hypothetical protein
MPTKSHPNARARRFLAAIARTRAIMCAQGAEEDRDLAKAYRKEAERLDASADRCEALSEQRRKRAAKLRRIKAAWVGACVECKIQSHSACLARDFPELDKCTCPLCYPTT